MDKPHNDLDDQLPITAIITGERMIPPHDIPARVKLDALAVVFPDSPIIEQLNELKRFRTGILKAVVELLRAGRLTRERRTVWLELYTGQFEKLDELHITIKETGEADRLWSIAWSDGPPSARSRSEIRLGSLALVLIILRSLLVQRTGKWMSWVPVESG